MCSAIMHLTDDDILRATRASGWSSRRQRRGGGVHESTRPRSRPTGSLHSLIPIQVAYLCEVVSCKAKLAAGFCRSVLLPYAQTSFDPPRAQRCPVGDLACFIMQITLHLPACVHACVCLCL